MTHASQDVRTLRSDVVTTRSRPRLEQIINLKHELVQFGAKIDWDWIDGEIRRFTATRAGPEIESRFVIGLLLLKHIYGLSDEGVCERLSL
jgi:IS5 family transposase